MAIEIQPGQQSNYMVLYKEQSLRLGNRIIQCGRLGRGKVKEIAPEVQGSLQRDLSKKVGSDG